MESIFDEWRVAEEVIEINQKERFKLEFIKFYPDIREKYELSPIEAILYGYIKQVIEFQRNVNKTPVCFTASSTMAQNIGCKTQSINNSIWKLKKKGLIEVHNKTWLSPEGKTRKWRKIYLSWEAPKNENDKVIQFFETFPWVVEITPWTKSIIWDWIYKQNRDINYIYNLILEHYEKDNFEINESELRELYAALICNDNLFNHLLSEWRHEEICTKCKHMIEPSWDCYCTVPS